MQTMSKKTSKQEVDLLRILQDGCYELFGSSGPGMHLLQDPKQPMQKP